MKENREWADNLGGLEAVSKGLKTYPIIGDVEVRLKGIGAGLRG